jgi:SAM-dependent methyltransferase
MSFDVGADAYGRFMGRYSEPLAAQFAESARLRAGQRVLDVGCGTGALTQQLVRRLGAGAVTAIDPSEPFVAAVSERFPDVAVRRAVAEELPFPDDTFDAALAQLVVHFMTDPVAGLSEMARVTRPGGVVAACVWDHAGGGSPLSLFWQAVLELDADARDESGLAGAREGHLAELFVAAGLHGIETTMLTVRVPCASVEAWWEPFTLGVGPAGDYVARLSPERQAELRSRCAALLPAQEPFEIIASAWTASGRV